MEQNKEKLISSINQNIDKLKSLYEQAKNEKLSLFDENEKLNQELQKKDTIIKELEEKNNSLKVAKAVLTGSSDATEAKQKINKLVREIDQCIALMNK
jgi:undecaprenyl pyrophosphate synthase